MGLDMYLYGVTRNYDNSLKTTILTLIEVGYWSKHNAIHNWIVQNVQDNEDNRAMYYLDNSHLKELLKSCNKVLANPTVENAMTILPTLKGCFFGGTDLTDDYEMEYYLDGLKYTVGLIRELLKDNKFEYYYYQASW